VKEFSSHGSGENGSGFCLRTSVSQEGFCGFWVVTLQPPKWGGENSRAMDWFKAISWEVDQQAAGLRGAGAEGLRG